MIPSVKQAKAYRLKIIRMSHLYNDFIRTKATELVNKMIVDPIIEEMKAKGVSRKIYENVECDRVVVKDDGIFVNIHNEYYADTGFDVAVAREEGTDDHMIRPRKKQALSWIQDGKRRFSGGHMVSGLPRLNIIEQIIEKNMYDLQQKLNDEIFIWKQLIMR